MTPGDDEQHNRGCVDTISGTRKKCASWSTRGLVADRDAR